uniref:Uncharacterized protein n=1 Tax=Candidatus Kentrum sp. LPFa TaxID=2126335 RepID=A0A450X5E1_9GAMM|nr:MAG: hypothetical protein BECKLPF1236B_GA0070989_14131 [Candidatus Kentron sp. LPFa]
MQKLFRYVRYNHATGTIEMRLIAPPKQQRIRCDHGTGLLYIERRPSPRIERRTITDQDHLNAFVRSLHQACRASLSADSENDKAGSRPQQS